MNYERYTAAPTRDVLRTAEEFLTARIPIELTEESRHSITLSGGDGTATITCHRHGLDTLVTVATDQLRTSRLDVEAQFFLQQLPYQPGDTPQAP